MAAYHVQDDPRRQRVGFGFLIFMMFMIFMIIAAAFLHFRKRKKHRNESKSHSFSKPSLTYTTRSEKHEEQGRQTEAGDLRIEQKKGN